MAGPTSIMEIDLTPIADKAYWNTFREWARNSSTFS
jgi:hypothetical protein